MRPAIPEWVTYNLCWYDRRNPCFVHVGGLDGGVAPRAKGCLCDPCSYGKDRLAVAMIELLEAADLKRNTRALLDPGHRSEWVAVPAEDFNRLRMVVEKWRAP